MAFKSIGLDSPIEPIGQDRFQREESSTSCFRRGFEAGNEGLRTKSLSAISLWSLGMIFRCLFLASAECPVKEEQTKYC